MIMSNRLCLPSSEQFGLSDPSSFSWPLILFCEVLLWSSGGTEPHFPDMHTQSLYQYMLLWVHLCCFIFCVFFPFVTSFLVLLVHHKQFTKTKFYMKSCIIFCSITQKNCRMLESVRGDISTQTLWCSVLAAVVSLRFFMFCLGDFWLVVFSWGKGVVACLFGLFVCCFVLVFFFLFPAI